MTDTLFLSRFGDPSFDRSAPSAEFASQFRELLDRFGYQNRFGISLLHTHWDGPDDVLIETIGGPHQAVVAPVNASRLPADAVAVQWMVMGDGLRVVQACAVHDEPPPPPD